MSDYSLNTLLKIRSHKKTQAEQALAQAISRHRQEKAKQTKIEAQLLAVKNARSRLQESFFQRAKQYSCNRREVLCHVSSHQKNVGDELSLNVSLEDQKEAVKKAQSQIEHANSNARNAHKDLKAIEKHFEKWQLANKRAEQLREEYQSDDLNSVKFLLKQRA